MEEKTKSIIYSVIAILLGIIIGGCTQVKAFMIPNLMTQVIQNNNTQNVTTTNNAWIATGRFFITVSNNGYTITDNNKEIPNYFWIRYCQQNENGKIKNLEGISVNSTYGDPLNTRVLYTNVPCTPYGTNLTGIEVYIEMKVGPGRGYYAGIDLDQGGTEIFNVYIEMRAEADSYIGLGELYYGYSNSPLHSSDIVDEEIKNQEAFIANQQEMLDQMKKWEEYQYNKPEKDEILSDYEEKEQELWEIIGVPNYNDLNIDIDGNTNSKIWNLIVYILNQNTAILTMVITILSISILKLILNR